ncbi:MAG: Ldh family oxidoreductase [Opitutus sp.]
MNSRYAASDLIAFSSALLRAAGLDADKAGVVAEILTEGDLLGHTTHGLALLTAYLGDLESGSMQKSGVPETIADYPAAITWDGRRLPGPWLVVRALEMAASRARQQGTCTVVIRRSHHIACLAAYVQRITDEGLMLLISCSDPTVASVAPHGGRSGVMTPNPLAAGWPTNDQPVMLDVSMSITTNGLAKRLFAEKRQAAGPWFITSTGEPTTDPSVVFQPPTGALLPIGGMDHGHKGYALGLLVEALTGGLAGHGRADPSEGWTATVFLQVIDPALFGGESEFRRQTTHVAEACRATQPRPGFEHVRLPGEAGLRKRATQLEKGIELYPGILSALQPWASRWAIRSPEPVAQP